MDYNHITNFLEKFKKIIFQKEEVKNFIIKIISEELNFFVEKEKVKIKNGIIFVDGSPIFRNELMMKKEKILLKIKNCLPDSNFFDIK